MDSKYHLSYAAGLFDGEGCIHIAKRFTRKGRLRYNLLFNMANNKSPSVLEFMKKLFGGSNIQTVFKKKGNPHWIWFISGYKAEEMLLKLKPYLMIKKEECKLALEFQSLNTNHDGRRFKASNEILKKNEEMYKKMRELKKPRWDWD